MSNVLLEAQLDLHVHRLDVVDQGLGLAVHDVHALLDKGLGRRGVFLLSHVIQVILFKATVYRPTFA